MACVDEDESLLPVDVTARFAGGSEDVDKVLPVEVLPVEDGRWLLVEFSSVSVASLLDDLAFKSVWSPSLWLSWTRGAQKVIDDKITLFVVYGRDNCVSVAVPSTPHAAARTVE
ncbi:MAG: hypothetical protein M1820_010888 [Bogoriella megaspora]|nr:MAG: hypothetical protein M1820_010888 [Bogoriella megaspora]